MSRDPARAAPKHRAHCARRGMAVLMVALLGAGLLVGCQQAATTETRGPIGCIDCESDCWPLPRLGPYCPELCDQTVPPDECVECAPRCP